MKYLLSILLIINGGYCMAQEKADEREFNSKEVRIIKVHTDSGRIILEAAPGPIIKVAITGEYTADMCKITTSLIDGVLFLEAKSLSKGLFGKHKCMSGFSITAPQDKLVGVKSGAGAITVGAFSAGADISCGAGSVKLTGTSGRLKISSGAGAISGEISTGDISLKNGAGTINLAWIDTPKSGLASLTSGAGMIKLTFPADSKANIHHSSGAGRFNSELGSDPSAPFMLKIATGAGSVKITKR